MMVTYSRDDVAQLRYLRNQFLALDWMRLHDRVLLFCEPPWLEKNRREYFVDLANVVQQCSDTDALCERRAKTNDLRYDLRMLGNAP